MEQLPIYISISFILTTALTLGIFYFATGNSKTTLWILLSWLALQTGIGLSGFYTSTDSVPPRFILLLLPPLLAIILLFRTAKGRRYIDNLNIKFLTLIHLVRIPVELVLFCLFLQKVIPQLMTFEGRNFDILSGISAPFIYYFFFIKKTMGKKAMMVWNIICLGLLFNIVTHAILSAPFPFQQLAFEQPNIAIFYFPFVWLPGFIVPMVLFAHLATIRKLYLS